MAPEQTSCLSLISNLIIKCLSVNYILHFSQVLYVSTTPTYQIQTTRIDTAMQSHPYHLKQIINRTIKINFNCRSFIITTGNGSNSPITNSRKAW